MEKTDEITLTTADLMKRYKVKTSAACKIMREIRDYTRSVLPRGRCLVEECEIWERRNREVKSDA